MWKCPNCGQELPDEKETCWVCNRPKDRSQQANADESRGPKGSSSLSSGEVFSPGSKQRSALMSRYKDAYIVARAVNGYGTYIKGLGVVVALLLLLIGLGWLGQGRPGDASFAMGVVCIAFGIVIGIVLFDWRACISTRADSHGFSAVNNSPFLTNEHRAKIMSLPE
jgi:hypothetical protein